MQTQHVVSLHPGTKEMDLHVLIACIDECADCAQACTSCADACLSEQAIEHLRQCIRLTLDCADMCRVTAELCSRRTGSNPDIVKGLLALCAAACQVCQEECARHADAHEHCRACAERCRTCADACRDALDFFGGDGISGTGVEAELSWTRPH